MLESRSLAAPRTRPARTIGLSLALVSTLACIEPPQRNGANDTEAKQTPTAPANKRQATIPAAGWNDQIAWRGLDEGLREAKLANMPVMLVVHTEWCGNCQKLKSTFKDTQLASLSEQFVMVHVDQDAQPEATLYGPDGQYIPRVMFLDPNGNIDQQLQNPNRPDRFRYFYTPQEDLVATMREALDRHGNKS